MEDIVIVSAARTPVGSFNGAFATVAATDLGATAVRAALQRAGVEPAEIDEVILGHVLAAAQGQNPARQAARAAGVPDEKTAFGINQVCGSGLRAVALAAQQIRTGESAVVAAGGMESMSLSAHAAYLRAGTKMGALDLTDTMLKDGLWDAFHGYHMGVTAENVAQKYQITREMQDTFAVASQNKASAASKGGRFADEIAPVTVKGRKGDTVVDTDEYIRHDSDMAAMAKLKPAFSKEGTVTAGNASGINDGAAALVLMSASRGEAPWPDPAGAHRELRHGRRGPGGDGHGPDPVQPPRAAAGRLVGGRPGPDRSQRGVRRSGLRGEQGYGLGYRPGEREWRRHRAGPPDRRLRRARAGDAAARDGPPGCQEGPGDIVHRRRHGRGDVPGALAPRAV